MLIAIVFNLLLNLRKGEQILICTPSISAADLIAEQLDLIPFFKGKVTSCTSYLKEKIFEACPNKLEKYTLKRKCFYYKEEPAELHLRDLV
jgi:hypothetical protein